MPDTKNSRDRCAHVESPSNSPAMGSSESKGIGLYSVMSANGTLPDFVDFYDRTEGVWKFAQVNERCAHRNKIKVTFVRADRRQYVSDWLRIDSTRLGPQGMYTSKKAEEARKKGKGDGDSKTPSGRSRDSRDTNPLHVMTAKREKDVEDLARGLRIAANINVNDNTEVGGQFVDDKIGIGDFVDVLNHKFRWEPATVRNLAVRNGRAQCLVRLENRDDPDTREEWIPFESNRIAPFGKKVGVKQHPYHVGQLVDVLHEYFDSKGNRRSRWRNAEVKKCNNYSIQVCFINFDLDEWIDVSRDPGRSRVQHAFSHTDGSATAHIREVEDHSFRERLTKNGFKVFDVENDGNCLFRAIALQVLGDVSLHRVVRQKCCDHLRAHADHFCHFAAGGDMASFGSYLSTMMKDSTWGGHLEIICMEEIWDRQILIYRNCSGTDEDLSPQTLSPVKLDSVEPIRLSYHGKSHYNAMTCTTSMTSFPLPHRETKILLEARMLANANSPRKILAKTMAEREENVESESSKMNDDDAIVTDHTEQNTSIDNIYKSQKADPVAHSGDEENTNQLVMSAPTFGGRVEDLTKPDIEPPSVPDRTWGYLRKSSSSEIDATDSNLSAPSPQRERSLHEAEW